MRLHWHTGFAFFTAFGLFACGGATHGEASGVPADGGTETSTPRDAGLGVDAMPGADTGAGVGDGRAPVDSSVPVGPGVLVFAGYGPGSLSDTWNWDGAAWTELPGAGPAVRSDQSMIGVAAGTVLLFGGEGLGSSLGDTWTWTTQGWSQSMAAGPSPREGAATALLHGKAILYGGSSPGGGFLSDTWQWDGTTWTELTPSGPTPGGRYGHSMATLGDTIVLFGNVGGPTDTWLFDGKAWTKSSAPGPTGEAGGLTDSRGFQTMATLAGKVWLFGGEQDANHILSDTWAWDGKSWTQMATTVAPPARFHAGMTAFQDKLVLFGGAGAIPNGPPILGDTWTWDGATWTEVATTGPSARYAYVLAVH